MDSHQRAAAIRRTWAKLQKQIDAAAKVKVHVDLDFRRHSTGPAAERYRLRIWEEL